MIALGLLQTKQGQSWAYTQFITSLEHTTQTKIQIKKINISFPFNLHLEDIAISQNNHLFMTVQDLELYCAFSKLLQGRLVFSKLVASKVDILQLIPSTQSILPNSSRPWDAPLLPFYVKFENIDILQIRLGQDVLEALALPNDMSQLAKDASLNLQGMISNNPFRKSMTAHLLITAHTGNSDLSLFSLGIDTQNHQLSLSLHCHQLPLQSIAPDLPPNLKAHLALYAAAPVDTWQRLAQNSEKVHKPIEGHFKLSLHSIDDESTFISTLIAHSSLRSRYLLKSKNEIELFDLKIDNPSFFLEGDAILTSDLEVHQGNFKGEIENLERFRALAGKEVQGKLTFDGHADGLLQSPSLILNLNSSQLTMSQQLFQNVHVILQTKAQNKSWGGFLTLAFDHQNNPWKLATSFDWNEQKHLRFYQLQADAMRSNLEGEVTFYAPDHVWEGELEVQTDHLNTISHFFGTHVSGEGQLKLQLAVVSDESHQKRQEFHAKLMGKDLRWLDCEAQQLMLDLHIDSKKEGVEFFQVHSHLEGEQVNWKEYSAGHCMAQATYLMDFEKQDLRHVSTEWNAQELRWPMGQARQAAGKANLENPLRTNEGTLQFTIQNIHTSTTYLEELVGSTTLHPQERQWPFHIQARGNWKENFLFAAEGSWHFQQDVFELQMNRLNGQFGPYPLQLLQPVHLLHNPDGMQLAGLRLQWGEAQIQAEFNQDLEHISSQFKTNAIPSELFHFITPELPLTGRATFQGYLDGPINDPRGQFQIDLQNIHIIEDIFTQKPLIAGRVDLYLNGRGIQLKSELNGIGYTPLQIAGTLPIALSLTPFNFKIDSQLPFDLALNAEGELDPYLHLFYNDVTNLSGQAKIALRLTGQMNSPQIQGHIDLRNGAYESLSTGALYHNIQAHLEGDGSKIILKQFSAQDNKSGSIAATGTVTLDANKLFPFEFQIYPSQIFILDSDYAAISASGPLSLIGNSKQSKLQGELTINQATIHLEEALPHQVKTVDVRYINLSYGEHPPTYPERKETSSAIGLDVKLNAPQNVLIEGNHLKSEWKGSIAVTGTPDNPQLHGDLRISSGEYDFNGKKFNLNQGNIHFAGAPDKKTTLYVVASKEIDRITAEIIVKGPANKPVISFRSNPPLSQREVLSYILFNRGISDITSDQGDQLSQSFISLNSNDQTKTSDDFLSRLRNNIGIDRLDFITNNDKENQDIGLQVGKNITENISVSVNQSMTSIAPIIAVEAKLLKNLKAQAEAGVIEDAPVRMSIKWKKDY
jgi:translocation and assembly module TamB